MNKLEVAKLLTVASMIDNRTVAPETVEAWHPLLWEYDYDDAVTAVQLHFKESDKYLMPAHIIANVKRVKDQRRRERDRQHFRQLAQITNTLDREKFDAETEAAIENARRERKSVAS